MYENYADVLPFIHTRIPETAQVRSVRILVRQQGRSRQAQVHPPHH